MNQPFYPFHSSHYALHFEFLSIGSRIIRKAVSYTQTEIPGLYSVALLDISEDGAFDDKSVSDNGDMEKILATVYQTFTVFFQQYPDATITFSGSTPSRTRLYRIAITHELMNVIGSYNIWGLIGESFEIFQPNQPYTDFAISRK